MRLLTGLTLAALTASAAVTPAGARIPQGCFARDYTADHLAKTPKQHIAALRISLGPDPWGNGFISAIVTGRFSDQGRARSEGFSKHSFRQAAFCGESGGKTTCQVECDGGSFTIRSARGDSLEIETSSFTLEVPDVGDETGCGGLSDLVEAGSAKTIYRLTRAPASACPPWE
ncbi:hypothetical protein M3484_18925 [Pseudomonas sp. GX19020]|uniref:hypothetical protein n=1 Tax=Pseudomonas sp. GX19020 TaxID=2942277 RepID=UPI002019C644|nr:hypothetical protein [Pseudomonas sp. GX19020]MCL4068642.1 hypothetical protein [Pseudomonas sp. GX19020]